MRIKQKLRDWLFSNGENEATSLAKGISVDHSSIDSDKAIRFTAYKAAGGMVVETNFYDRIKDRSYRSLHIITDDKDLGYEIGKIITIESMKV
jgi:hypothetical protein